MGNQFTVSGSGELDNGLTVSLSMQIDSGVPFDDHSLTVASEDFGTVKFSGHGGGSAATSVDGSVAGDIWDGYDGTALATVIAGTTVANATTAAVATTVTITDNESTNENNAIIFTAGGDVDGGLIGRASLNSGDFAKIVNAF